MGLAVAHFKNYLKMAMQTCLITDMACLIAMVSNDMVEPRDPVVARQSHRLFALNFPWLLRHEANKNLVISDALSRLYGRPTPISGLAFTSRQEMTDYFNRAKIEPPKEWLKSKYHITTEMFR